MQTDGASAPAQTPASVGERIAQYSTFAPWLQADAIPFWNEIRGTTAVARSEEHGGYWILTRHEDIAWAARHPEIFASNKPLIPHHRLMGDELQIPLELDGDPHRAWRRTLAEAFNPAAVSAITPRIREAAIDTVERIADKERCEFVSEFAVTLPAEAFLANFGIGQERLQEFISFKDWYVQEALPNANSTEDIKQAATQIRQFFADEVERRRAEGRTDGPDVIAHMMRATYEGRPLTVQEITNASVVSMLASLDTTTSALGLAWVRMASDPEIRSVITAAPEKVPALVEELIRIEPVLTTARVVTQEVERHGITFFPGDKVLMSWGMSGLDPEIYEQPQEFRADRVRKGQLAFGIGPHRCLGMHVARRVLAIALEEWHARIPNYRLDPEQPPVMHYSPVRGVKQVHLLLA